MGVIPPNNPVPPHPKIIFYAIDEYGNEEVVPAPIKKEEPERIESRLDILDL